MTAVVYSYYKGISVERREKERFKAVGFVSRQVKGKGVRSSKESEKEKTVEREEWKEKVNKALLKVAQGCAVAEVVEEYVEVDGELKLTKRKKTKKEIPPDLKALQLLLEEKEEGFGAMSEEQLIAERERLIAMLAKEQETEKSDAPLRKKRGKAMKRARKKKTATEAEEKEGAKV